MEEYKKIFTVLKKINPEYPHETILVLDATTGQNALNQVEEFKKISNLTGLIITKLDTSAKGGILLAICKKYGLPIIAVGMGEKESDLHSFNSKQFSKMLVKIKNENTKKIEPIISGISAALVIGVLAFLTLRTSAGVWLMFSFGATVFIVFVLYNLETAQPKNIFLDI